MSSNAKQRIMIVDDSPQDIRILLDLLGENFLVNAATSAEDAYRLLETEEPPVVMFLDVNMPDVDGYEACKTIKSNSEWEGIEVIFLSGNDSTKEIINGFDVGASDYIVKPFSPEILLRKLKRGIAASSNRKRLTEAADSANKMAMTAMSDSGDLGVLVNFLRSSFKVNSIAALPNSVIESCNLLGLNIGLYFYRDDMEYFSSTNGNPSELEAELLIRLKDYPDPFLEKGNRLFIVQKNIVMLVRKMPEDEEKRGRVRDYLMILLEGVRAKLEYIEDQRNIESRREERLHEVIYYAENSLKEIQSMQEEHKRSSVHILDDMVRDIEKSFFSLGLTDQQEEELLNMMTRSVEKALDHFDTGLMIDEKVKDIIRALSSISPSSDTESP